MERCLCIDTSVGSAVALVAGGEVLAQEYAADPRAHAEHLTGMIRRVCAVADGDSLAGCFDSIVVGRGPAPYTGLRAGLVSARVLARVTGADLFGISALEILGRGALDISGADEVMVCSDARRKEVYAARIKAVGPDDVAVVGDFLVDRPEPISTLADSLGLPIGGPGADLYADIFTQRIGGVEMEVALAARIVAARLSANPGLELGTEPLYLRRPDVQVPSGKK